MDMRLFLLLQGNDIAMPFPSQSNTESKRFITIVGHLPFADKLLAKPRTAGIATTIQVEVGRITRLLVEASCGGRFEQH